jgi:hypothetical protein
LPIGHNNRATILMELDPVQLNREIGQLETDLARLDIEQSALTKSVSRAARRRRYLQLARSLRKPTASFPLWPFAVLLIAPLVLGLLSLIFVSFVSNSAFVSMVAFLIGALAGAAVFAALLYRPADAVLASAIAQSESEWQSEKSRYEEISGRLSVVNQQLQQLLDDRRQLAASEKLQRAMLLQRNWKAMRGIEWEDFLVEVCRTLGAHVDRVPNSAYVPPGPNKPVAAGRKTIVSPANHLIVTLSPRRIAVATIAGISPFHPAAVQQSLNELAQHGCDTSAIIANTRLTAGSRELAAHRRCTLIGEDEFPDFVLGKLTL